MAVTTIDLGQRDLGGADLYATTEGHFNNLHGPVLGRRSVAPDQRSDETAIAFTGTILTELAGYPAAGVCLPESPSSWAGSNGAYRPETRLPARAACDEGG